MMISLQEVLSKRDAIFSEGRPVAESFPLFFKWLGENEANFSAEASEYFENICTKFSNIAEKNLKALPDSPETRKGIRKAAIIRNDHRTSEGLLKGLEREPPDQDELAKDWSQKTLNLHQVILDLLFDLTAVSSEVEYSAVMLGLLYSCVDELTAAHHLARFHYYPQANNHLRTVLETLDRIELFFKDSKFIELWSSADKVKIRRELSPSNVRVQLGKEKFDPIYGFLSEHGTHPTYEMFKTRAVKSSSEGFDQARIFVAGTPLEHSRIFHCEFSFIVGNFVVSKIMGLFSEHFNAEEGEALVNQLVKDTTSFNEAYFIPWAKENGIDASELLSAFDSFSGSENVI